MKLDPGCTFRKPHPGSTHKSGYVWVRYPSTHTGKGKKSSVAQCSTGCFKNNFLECRVMEMLLRLVGKMHHLQNCRNSFEYQKVMCHLFS